MRLLELAFVLLAFRLPGTSSKPVPTTPPVISQLSFDLVRLYTRADPAIATVNLGSGNVTHSILNVTYYPPMFPKVTPDPTPPLPWGPSTANDCYSSTINHAYPRNKFCIDYTTGKMYATAKYFDAPMAAEGGKYVLIVTATDASSSTNTAAVTLHVPHLCRHLYEKDYNALLQSKCDIDAKASGMMEGMSSEEITITVDRDVKVVLLSVKLTQSWVNATFPETVTFTASMYNKQVSVPVVYNEPPSFQSPYRNFSLPTPLYSNNSTMYARISLSAMSDSGVKLQLSPSRSMAYFIPLKDYCQDSNCSTSVHVFNKALETDGFARCFKELDNRMLEHLYGGCNETLPPIVDPPSGRLSFMLPAVADTVVARVMARDPDGGGLLYYISLVALDGTPSLKFPNVPFYYDCTSAQTVPFCMDRANGDVKVTKYLSEQPALPTGTNWTINILVANPGKAYRTASSVVSITTWDDCSPVSNFITDLVTSNCFATALKLVSPVAEKTGLASEEASFDLRNVANVLFEVVLSNVTLPQTTSAINISVSVNPDSQIWRVFPLNIYNATSGKGTFRMNYLFDPSYMIAITVSPIAGSSVLRSISLSAANISVNGYLTSSFCSRPDCLGIARQLLNQLNQQEPAKQKRCVSRSDVAAILSCFEPPTLTRQPQNYTKSLTSDGVSFSCSFLSRLKSRISWYKDGQLIDGSKYVAVLPRKRREAPQTDRQWFSFKPANADEQGFYQCRVESGPHDIKSNAGLLFYEDVSTSNVTLRITSRAFTQDLKNASSNASIALQKEIVSLIATPISNNLLGQQARSPQFVIHSIRPGSIIVNGMLYMAGAVTPASHLAIFSNLSSEQPRSEALSVDWGSSSLVSFDACGADKTGNLAIKGVFDWPATLVKETATIACPHTLQAFGNVATRRCEVMRNLLPMWSLPDDSACAYKSATTQQLDALSKVLVNASNVDEVVSQLYNLTRNESSVTNTKDIEFAVDILESVEAVGPVNPRAIDELVGVLSAVAGANIFDIAHSQTQHNSSARILASMQSIVDKFPFPEVKDSVKTSIQPHAAFAVTFVDSQSDAGLSIVYQNEAYTLSSASASSSESQSSGSDSSIFLPASALSLAAASAGVAAGSLQRVTTFSYPTGALFMSPKQVNMILDGKATHGRLHSRILSAAIGNVTVRNLTEPVVGTFKPSSDSSSYGPLCVFWQFNMSGGSGGWSSAGCHLARVVSNRAVCYCNHLTNFAILLDVDNPSKSKTSNLGLEIVTYIGIGISIACLILTLVSYAIFKSVRRKLPPRILMSLCVALLGVYLIFVIGIDRTSPVNGCRVVAMLLHYFLLATFLWMVTEAFNLYLCFVKVVGYYKSRFMIKASILCWGLPGVIVVISAIANFSNYGSANNCMVGHATFYVTLLAPVVLILLANFVILVLVMRGLRRGASVGKDKRMSLHAQARAAFGCSTLLGLTWVFGVLAVGDLRLLFQWLFCLANCLQGVFIFVFYCVRNQDIVNEWKKLLGIRSDKDKQSGTGSTGTKKKLFSKKTSTDHSDGIMMRHSPIESHST